MTTALRTLQDIARKHEIAPGPGMRLVWAIRLGHSWRLLVLACFGAWVLTVGSHHEPWFDEAQAWSLARDNALWTLLSQRVRYEGTPGLWHTVLWLVIRAGLPYGWIFVVPAGFALAGAALVLWRAPFPAPLRTAVLASYFFGYQFSVVARGYCMDLLLFPLAATFFAARVDRPIRYAMVIGLIANANAHGFLVGGVLGLELAWQVWRSRPGHRRVCVIALALAAAMGLFALYCAWQPADNGYLQSGIRGNPIMVVMIHFCNAFVDRVTVWSSGPLNTYDVFGSVVISILLLRPVVTLVLAGHHKTMASALVGIFVVFSALVYAAPWHSGLLFLVWLFLLWVEWDNPVTVAQRRNVMLAMAIVLGVQTAQTLRTGLWDIDHVYAPGQQAAAALSNYRRAHPQARIFAYGDYAFDVQPWLPGNPYANYHGGAGHPSYDVWNRGEPWMAGSEQLPTHLDFWHKVLAQQPDLIVVSRVNRMWVTGQLADLAPQACQAGYDIRQVFPGRMIWRGMLAGDTTLYLFERGTDGPCARDGARGAIAARAKTAPQSPANPQI